MALPHARLGRTGLRVSRLCLGTMTFGLQCDEATSFAILDRAFDAGITFLDTADMYPIGGDFTTVGRTEEIIGEWMRAGKRRDDVVLATKCSGAMGPNPWDAGNSRMRIMTAIDESLRRLGTDHIDLYQLHFHDPITPIEESLAALDDLVRMGKVRYVGCSNFHAYQVARALGRSEVRGLARFDTVQPRYNLLFREFERELFPLCADEGVGVIPFNPIAGGMLSGKHRPGPPTAGTRFTLGNASQTYQDRYWHDRAFASVTELQAVADEAGLDLVTMAVAWVLANPVVSAPIIGVSRPEQLDANVAAVDVTLDADLKARLDAMTVQYRWGDADR